MYRHGSQLLTRPRRGAVKTRTLIILALVAGLAILVAFALQVTLVAR